MKLEPGNEYVKIEMRNQSCTHQEVLVFSTFCNVTEYVSKAVRYDPFQFWNRPDKILDGNFKALYGKVGILMVWFDERNIATYLVDILRKI